MSSIILNADYTMGIGDFLVKLYALSHLNKYLKEKYPDVFCILILEEYQSRILSKILNLDFFQNFFDKFILLNHRDSSISGLGTNNVLYNNTQYSRVYSAINDYTNNKQGYWDLYLESGYSLLNIPYTTFDYRDPTFRQSEPIPDYNLPIFSQHLFDEAEKFVNEKLHNNFVSIYYRSLHNLDQNHLVYSTQNILKHIDTDKNYFITTNSEIAKKYLLSNIPQSITFPSALSKTDGCGTASTDQSDIERLCIEMFIMAYGSKILYAGNHHYISLYNYYAHIIKRIPLIEC